MSYNRTLLIIIFFLAGCATDQQPSQQAGTQLITSPPTSGDIERYREALTQLAQHKYQDASPVLLDLTQQHPDLAGPWANLGLISLRQGNTSDAEKYVREALKHNPRLPAALNLLGSIEYTKGNIRVAEKLFLDAIDSNPDYSMAHYNIALLYDIFLQDIAKAISHYEKYLQLTGNNDTKTQQWLEELRTTLKRG